MPEPEPQPPEAEAEAGTTTAGPSDTARRRRLAWPRAGSRRVDWRAESRAALEIVALCGLAITQPLLDVTGRSPDFFLFHGAGAGQVLLLVAVIALVPPLTLWGVGLLAGLLSGRPAVRQLAHTGTLGALLTALAIQVGKGLLPLRGVPLVVLAAGLGVAGGYAYRRWRAPGQLLRVASVGPLVFVSLFVFASPASAVVLPGGGGGETRAAGGAASGGPGTHPPVVLLILDEFPLVSLLGPDGALDERRFPHFARLARESTWYRNATGVSGWTPYALPAMLTGRYPAEEGAPHHSRYPENLFTAFGDAGYEIRAQESITQLCPPRHCPDRSRVGRGGLPALLRESAGLLAELVRPYDSDRDPEASYRETTRREAGLGVGPGPTADPNPTDPKFRWGALDDNQPARFAAYLAGLRPSDRPTLHLLHLLMPHSPWNYLPSGVRYEAPFEMPNDGPGWLSLAYQRHLAQVEYTDRLLGETIRTLEATGLYDDALLVVTADHGLSFTPGVQGRSRDAVDRAPGEVLWVPTFVKEPGQRAGRVDDRNWEQVDLLPTVADLAGVPVPWAVEGVAAGQAPRPGGDKRYHDEPGAWRAIPGPATFAAVTSGAAHPAAPAAPFPELVGRPVTDFAVRDDGGPVSVGNLADFDDIDADAGRLPALVHGSVPSSVPDGTALAIAVNGRIGAVTPVVAPDSGGRRFAALVPDESLFVPGGNRLEIFAVDAERTLHRLVVRP